jgi:hypothetical protein
MHPDLQTILNYISECLGRNIPIGAIHDQLLKQGWPEDTLNQAFAAHPSATGIIQSQQANPVLQQPPTDPHKIRNGVFILTLPYIILTAIALIQFLLRAINIHSPALNILTILLGIIAVIGIPVCGIVGILRLVKH